MEEEYQKTEFDGSFGGNKENLLRQLDPKYVIEELKLHFLGLTKVYDKDYDKIRSDTKRISKPMFTYEFVQNELLYILTTKLNFMVQVSRFDKKEILRRIYQDDKRLINLLATEGSKYYISDKQWEMIMKLHENKQLVEVTTTDEDGNEKKKLEWQSYWKRNGINWKYDMPVDNQMIEMTLVKNDDDSNKWNIFHSLRAGITTLSFASFNKSYAAAEGLKGMFVEMLGDIRKESTVLRENQDKKKAWGEN